MEKFAGDELKQALGALSARIRTKTEIVIGGAGALILSGELARATSDCDVIFSDPEMGRLQEDIRAVAGDLNLTAGWLNGSVQAYLDILPPDYKTRIKTLPMQGKLQVAVLHRQDVLAMKAFAGRAQDIEDIVALKPTPSELQFVRGQIPRLQRIDPARATRMEGLLNEFLDGQR